MAGKIQEEQLQAKYYEFQVINQQIQQYQEQQQLLDEQVTELNHTLECLNEIENTKTSETILVPIGQGIFTKAELKDNKNLIINVGSNILASKDIASAKTMIGERKQAVDIYRENTSTSINGLVQKAKRLELELQEILGDIRS
jgi:prefoldin alpha subunit